jgi:hypothetical protein
MNSGESKPSQQEKTKEKTLSSFLERLGIRSAAAFSRRIDCSEKTIYNWKRTGGEPSLTIRQFKLFMCELSKAGIPLEEVPDRFYPEDKPEGKDKENP